MGSRLSAEHSNRAASIQTVDALVVQTRRRFLHTPLSRTGSTDHHAPRTSATETAFHSSSACGQLTACCSAPRITATSCTCLPSYQIVGGIRHTPAPSRPSGPSVIPRIRPSTVEDKRRSSSSPTDDNNTLTQCVAFSQRLSESGPTYPPAISHPYHHQLKSLSPPAC